MIRLTQDVYDKMGKPAQKVMQRLARKTCISLRDCTTLLADSEVKKHAEMVASIEKTMRDGLQVKVAGKPVGHSWEDATTEECIAEVKNRAKLVKDCKKAWGIKE